MMSRLPRRLPRPPSLADASMSLSLYWLSRNWASSLTGFFLRLRTKERKLFVRLVSRGPMILKLSTPGLSCQEYELLETIARRRFASLNHRKKTVRFPDCRASFVQNDRGKSAVYHFRQRTVRSLPLQVPTRCSRGVGFPGGEGEVASFISSDLQSLRETKKTGAIPSDDKIITNDSHASRSFTSRYNTRRVRSI